MSFQAGEKYSLDGHQDVLYVATNKVATYGDTLQEFLCLKGGVVYITDEHGKIRRSKFSAGCPYRFYLGNGQYKKNPYIYMNMTPVSGADEKKVKLLINMAMDSKSDATREELVDTLYRVLFTPSGLNLSQANQ